ncbi:flagellar brake protein [Pseudomonas sp. LRF_L74]|uniref:flagellar brake protein n=1 Tax=Pseudomonas sp. LRF_L74 TaxID=3369422 RepID=UPI003F648536
MSNPFAAENGPQPPKILKAPLEIIASLRQLQQHHDPLVLTFKDRSQRFQSYLVEIDRERSIITLDELIPNDGERFLKAGEAFRIEGFHDGVRIAWDCEDPVQVGEYQGATCYWCHLPEEVIYHQRRSAYRAPVQLGETVVSELSGTRLSRPLKGLLLDISATGCKLRFVGNVTAGLQTGQVYENLSVQMPFGTMTTAAELRHISYEEKVDSSFAGLRFHHLGGQEQRQIERFVYQLQREAAAKRKDD